MKVYRVRLTDGRYLQAVRNGSPIWTENKADAIWWARSGGARNMIDWLMTANKLRETDPNEYLEENDEARPETNPGD